MQKKKKKYEEQWKKEHWSERARKYIALISNAAQKVTQTKTNILSALINFLSIIFTDRKIVPVVIEITNSMSLYTHLV